MKDEPYSLAPTRPGGPRGAKFRGGSRRAAAAREWRRARPTRADTSREEEEVEKEEKEAAQEVDVLVVRGGGEGEEDGGCRWTTVDDADGEVAAVDSNLGADPPEKSAIRSKSRIRIASGRGASSSATGPPRTPPGPRSSGAGSKYALKKGLKKNVSFQPGGIKGPGGGSKTKSSLGSETKKRGGFAADTAGEAARMGPGDSSHHHGRRNSASSPEESIVATEMRRALFAESRMERQSRNNPHHHHQSSLSHQFRPPEGTVVGGGRGVFAYAGAKGDGPPQGMAAKLAAAEASLSDATSSFKIRNGLPRNSLPRLNMGSRGREGGGVPHPPSPSSGNNARGGSRNGSRNGGGGSRGSQRPSMPGGAVTSCCAFTVDPQRLKGAWF